MGNEGGSLAPNHTGDEGNAYCAEEHVHEHCGKESQRICASLAPDAWATQGRPAPSHKGDEGSAGGVVERVLGLGDQVRELNLFAGLCVELRCGLNRTAQEPTYAELAFERCIETLELALKTCGLACVLVVCEVVCAVMPVV